MINIHMGIKISSLPNNTLPYTGSEEIPLVQSGQTRAGTLSSFVNYLSGALLSDSELRALSGNWQSTYTTFSSNSSNYAVKNADNNFTNTQTISVVETTKVKFGAFKAEINNNGNIIFGYNVSNNTAGTNNIKIGSKALSDGGNNIVIGQHPNGVDPVFDSASTNNIALGTDITASSDNGPDSNIIIGNESFINSFGYEDVQNNIIIGSSAGLGGGIFDNIVIGRAASSSGSNNIVLGADITTNDSNCILLGNGAESTTDNQLAFGGLTPEAESTTPTHRLPVTFDGVLYYLILGSAP